MSKKLLVALLAGSIFSLTFASDLYSDGVKAYNSGDYKKAYELYQKSCDSGDVNGCVGLGFVLENGKGVETNYLKASELYQKACNLNNADGCWRLGYMYSKGNGVNKDLDKASKLYDKSCIELKNDLGCNTAGSFYYELNNYSKAFELYSKSCKLGFNYGCANEGVMYQSGKGVKQDYAKAVELYQKACDGNNAYGCRMLGEMYKSGEGVTPDNQKSKALLSKACELKDERACELIK